MEKYREIHRILQAHHINSLTAVECIDYLDRLYAIRHDIVDQMIKHDWSDNKDAEEPIGKVLLFAGIPNNIITALEKKIIPDHPSGKTLKAFFKMTPDNYKITGALIEFVEVTVTTDVDKGIREKKLKYESGLKYLEQELHTFFLKGEIQQPYKITLQVVSVRTDGSNISTQWPSRRTDGVVQYMRLVQAEISYVREHLVKAEERAALEAMFNLKFNISSLKTQPYFIPEYKGINLIAPKIDGLLQHTKEWLSKTHSFSFYEVKGSAVFDCFNSNEATHGTRYPMSKQPRNFLLIQCSLISSYKPATILSDQVDSRRACNQFLSIIPETPVSSLIHDIAYKYSNLTREDMLAFYSPRIHFNATQNVKEPGTFKLTATSLRPDSKAMLDILSKHNACEKKGALIESLNISSHITQSDCVSLVTKILSDLELNITETSIHESFTTKHTYVDNVLEKFFKNETQRYLIDVLKKTTAWHIGHMIRDITESLIAHSGLRRSKYWSLHAYNNGSVILFILPSKSLEVAGSFVRFVTAFKMGPGLVDKDNLDSVIADQGCIWGISKVMSLDLNRLLALNIAFEKALVATATWFQYYTEDQGQFPLQHAVRSVFAYHFLLSVCQKMKICAIFDNLRYLIPAVTSLYSGFPSLIEKLFERPFKSSLEVYIYYNIKSLLVALAQNNKARFYSKVKLLGLTVDQSTVGASGIYPSFLSRVVYKHYRSLISEVTTCFFLFEKGLHGNVNEEAKIHLETVEWAIKFRKKEETYGEVLVEGGYTLDDLCQHPELVEQQLYCQEAVELAAAELNLILLTKSQVVANSMLSKYWETPYFSQTRNISLKGMSGQVQEDGHLSSSVTIIEAIRYLSNSQQNPSVLKLYEETRKIKAQARIVRKFQRTEADRGFFITTLATRCRLEIIEDYYDAISKNVAEEYISYGGERKILCIQSALEKALRWASGESFIDLSNGKFIRMKRKLMYVSADATKWSPGDNSAKFRRFTAAVHNGLPDERLKNCVIDALRQIYKTDFFMSRKLRRYIDSMETLEPHVKEFCDFFPDGHHGEVRGNWLQGNLNKCSSLFGVAMSLLFKRLWQELFPELDCFFEFAHHSDDALFIYGYLEPVDDGTDWFLYVSQQIQAGKLYWYSVNTEMWKSMFNLHEHILLLGSIKISPKKTTLSPTNAEFLSTFFEGCAVSIPFVKILLGSLSDLPGLGYFDDLAAAQSRCVKALDMGASPQIAQLAVALCTSKVERLYGTALGMVNHPATYLQVKHEDTPIPLGGNGSMSIMELATAEIGMSDKNLLKRALLGFMHKRQKQMVYILGLFKFLMNLSKDTFQHERLGEFSFMGKVQWKIFIPKSEFEFSDMYTHKFLKIWSDQHATYDYIIPKGRDNLIIYLVRKINDPSIVTAMTMQSPLQLRFRMQAKQHMKVCKLGEDWVTFREVLAAAHSFASTYEVSQIDLDLFQTLTDCTFSKEYAWKDFLNSVHCDVIPTKQVQRAKVARTFTVREKDQIIQNSIPAVIGYKFAISIDEMSDVLDVARFPDSLAVDLKTMKDGVYRELGLNISDPEVMKKVAPMLYKSAKSRVVIVQGNVEGTAESICAYWLKTMSLVKTIRVKPHKEVLRAVSIFNRKEDIGQQKDLAALRLCIEIWRWSKANNAPYKEWFHALWFEDKTFSEWLDRFIRVGVPPVDPEIQCAALMIADIKGDLSVLQLQANRRAYSGKQYDAYCVQTYNEVTKLYEGDLRVTFNFGLDCARLEIFWEKQTYILETSITQKHVLKIMMDEVTKELLRCGMRFKTEQVSGARHLVLYKTESGFEWGKPNIPCIVYKNCALRTGLRTNHAINHKFMISIKDDGLRAIAQFDEESPRFLLAHAFHTIKDIRYQAVDAVSNVWFYHKGVKLFLNPIISSGLFENFLKNLPAAIPPAAYSLIMNRAKISVDLFMFNDLLRLINPNNVLDLSGLQPTEDGFSTVSSMSSRLWSEEVSFVDDDEEMEDEFTIDLQDVDFENIDMEADIEHFLQDESSYTGDLLIMSEETEVKKMRGIVKLLEPVKLIKSWVSKGLSIEKVYSPVNIILMTRYLSKNFSFSDKQVSLLDPYDLTELESIVKGWGESVVDQFETLDKEAQHLVISKGICPEDVVPDSLFSFRHTIVLLRRLFPPDSVTTFY
ncbi:RNA polymerase [Orthohantavirus sangassouense]|uniref:RNA-directed RNA polymerase L n=3 Tax=Orthohantavirus sangassouense TaxID=3052496 RepID=H6WCR0_9VIRU|nr:RNA polymerase [Orthohantavirus sangassouense]AEZ02948.1 RNA polymerase [Orthohantavirus sangassouense]